MAHERAFDEEDAELLRAVAHQTAVGLKKAELIERLTAENIVKDMFEALAAGSVDAAEAKASEARCDLSRPHVFIHAVRAPSADEDGPAWPEVASRFEARLRRLYPRAFFDSRHDFVRAIAPLPTAGAAAVERLRQGCEELARDEGVVVGVSDVDRGAASARRRMREAADAARIGRSLAAEGGAVSYEGLGAYKYLVHLELEDAPHDRYRQSVEELIALRPPPRRPARGDARALPGRPRQRGRERAGALHPPEYGASAAGADRARDRARPRQGGPALPRARAQAGPPPRRPRGPGVAAWASCLRRCLRTAIQTRKTR